MVVHLLGQKWVFELLAEATTIIKADEHFVASVRIHL